MGTHTGGIGRGPRAATAPGGRRGIRPVIASLPQALPVRLDPRTEEPDPKGGFEYRKTEIGDGPLPPLRRRPALVADPAAELDAAAPMPSWSALTVALPLFAVAWVCFAALAAATTPPEEADVAALGHILALGAGVVALVLLTLSVAHTQVSGRWPRPAAVGVAGLGVTQGAAAAALSSGPSDLWGLAAQAFLLIGFAVPLAWVGGQFQSGVRRQRVERNASMIASWVERARHQANETVESAHRHDVRSMLFVVDGAARALTGDAHPLSDAQRESFAQMLNESVGRLGSLMDVRPDSIEPFALDAAARAVIHAERKAGRTVTADLPDGLTAIGRVADVTAVLRTLIGLTSRRTTTSSTRAGGVQIRGQVAGGAAVLRVEPAGAEDLPLLTGYWEEVCAGTFKSSSRADDTSIDLYVAARLLAEQGGDLWSTAGGDCFAVRLPATGNSGSEEEV